MRSAGRAVQLHAIALLAAFGLTACGGGRSPDPSALLDASAPELAAELAAGRVSAAQIVAAALGRIAALDDAGPQLNAIIEINPDAAAIAAALDRRLAESGPLGPLHGVPVVLKANIDTADAMATTAGSLAMIDNHAAEDAPLVARLRASGAVIIAKANLSEWANYRGFRSSSGWSSLGGQTRNPYALDRSPCGSSSGSAVAVAARIVPLAVGTETDGSIVCPAAMNGVVGIKPTHGLVSTRGIIPVAASLDVAGPMARTVRGAALLLAAMLDEPDSERVRSANFDRRDLEGVRLGVLRDYIGAGSHAGLETMFGEWLSMLEQSGAELTDPINLELPDTFRPAEGRLMAIEFAAGIEDYLAQDPAWPDTLAELIAFNSSHSAEVMPHFGQERFENAALSPGLNDPEHASAITESRSTITGALEQIFAESGLEALLAPVTAPAFPIDWEDGDTYSVGSSYVAAVSGYPSVVVPGGLIDGLPVALSFIGTPNSEALLLELAAVFESARGALPPPRFESTLAERPD